MRVNNAGESTASVASGDETLTEDGRTLTVQIAETGGATETGYKIYRKDNNTGGKYLYVTTIVKAGATTDFVDANVDMPGTAKAFAIDEDPNQVLAFKQLAPLMKLPLATISASIRFLILLYGMPIVYNPRKIVVLKNIGTTIP